MARSLSLNIRSLGDLGHLLLCLSLSTMAARLTTLLVLALCCTGTSAFVPAVSRPVALLAPRVVLAAADLSAEVDTTGNNVAVKELLQKVESQQLLSKIAASGLLSKAQDAGISLSKLEPLLGLAADNPEILILVEASGPELLPLLPKLVDLAPPALPLLASAITIPTPVIASVGVGALAAAAVAVGVIPDDSVTNVALQTLVVGLSLPVAAASLAGAAILGQLK